MTRKFAVLTLVVLAVGVWSMDIEAKKPKAPKIATGPMDDGTLDPFWFGEGLEFREASEIDYLWVKEGFSLDGKSLHFEQWPEPQFQGEDAEDRDEKDHELAQAMSADMAGVFAKTFAEVLAGKGVTTSLEEGEIVASGRVVDCSTGSTAAKVLVGFGAGSGNTTIDLKLSDAENGELLVAIHHRVVSGTTWSTTDSKFINWIEDLADEINDEGLARLYEKGKPTNK